MPAGRRGFVSVVSARSGARIYRTPQIHPTLRLAGCIKPQPGVTPLRESYVYPQTRLQVHKDFRGDRQRLGCRTRLPRFKRPELPVPAQRARELVPPEVQRAECRHEPQPEGRQGRRRGGRTSSPSRDPPAKPSGAHPQQHRQRKSQRSTAPQRIENGRGPSGETYHPAPAPGNL